MQRAYVNNARRREVGPDDVSSADRNLICKSCERPVLRCRENIYVAHFRHKRRNPDCKYSVDLEEQQSSAGSIQQQLRLVLRRSWTDETRRSNLRSDIIGNAWSLAVRVPRFSGLEPSHDTNFHVRVGTHFVDSRQTKALRDRSIDIPVLPEMITYNIVRVDNFTRSHKALLSLGGAAPQKPVTVFRATVGGVSVETRSTKWSFAYDILCPSAFKLEPVPDDVLITEIPTDRSLAHYRQWSCYRVRLPAEPSAESRRWVNRLNIQPEYPEVQASLIWPQSSFTDSTGIRCFPNTRQLMIATHRASIGPAYLHANVQSRNYSYEIPGTVGGTSVFVLDLPETDEKTTMISYGIDSTADTLDWWPTDNVDIVSLDSRPVAVPSLSIIVSAGNADTMQEVEFPSLGLASVLQSVRLGNADIDSVSIPDGISCNIKLRSAGTHTWKSVSIAGVMNLIDGTTVRHVLNATLRKPDKDICISFNGFGSVFLSGLAQRIAIIAPSYKTPWLTSVLRNREAMSLGASTCVRNDVAVLKVIAARGGSQLIAHARLAVRRKVNGNQ